MKLIIDISDKNIARLRSYYGHGFKVFNDKNDEAEAVEAIYNAKTLQTGHWILREEWFDDEERPRPAYGCSLCGFSLKSPHDKRGFCPNCGSIMERRLYNG